MRICVMVTIRTVFVLVLVALVDASNLRRTKDSGINGSVSLQPYEAGEMSFSIKNQELIMRRKLRSSKSSTQSQKDIAKGKTVALLQVHFEGNVGDQMETIPLLRKLKEWGVVVDCYLSVWMPLKKRLDPAVHERVKDLVRNIYPEGVQYDHELRDRNYDLLIVTPGPTVNEIAHCITATRQLPNANWATSTAERPKNISMVWFGVTITGWAERTYEKQKYCTKLIAVREEESMRRAGEMLDVRYRKMNQLFMSGDISFSYPYDKAAIKKLADEKFYKTLDPLKGTDWALIFSRENNFGVGKGVWIRGSKVHVRSIDDEVIQYNIHHVVFGSSSNLEDHRHMNRLKSQHGVRKSRTVTCTSVEEMFALVSSAPHVITDRYHPGVASMIVGTKLSITKYVLEATKMGGLHGMIKYKHDDILDMNVEAFGMLLEIIQSSKGATKEETEAANKLALVGSSSSTMGGVFSKMVVDTSSLPPPPPEVSAAEDAAADQAAERAETIPVADTTDNEPSSPWASLGSSSSSSSLGSSSDTSSASSSSSSGSVLDMFLPVQAPTIQLQGTPQFQSSQDKFLLHQAGELSGLATVKPRKIPSMCLRNPSACDLSKFDTSAQA